MTTWSSGYNVDLGYTFGYYREMSPRWLDFVTMSAGIAPPRSDWRYLEFGCGQGMGLVLLAASNPDHDFMGVDFNPLHIAHARKLATEANLSNVRFEEADFVELAKCWPPDWGKFDYVTAHGTYSWLATSVRRALVHAIERATTSGSIVYLSYNALPGWTSTFPIQHLLRLWQTSEEIRTDKAIGTGLERLRELAAAKPAMMNALPHLAGRLEQMAGLDHAYLVQEYLHDDWHPMWFDATARELSAAKLNFVGTATLGDAYLPNLLSQEQRRLLAGYDNPIVRQVMLDALVNQSFRRDVFARGGAPLWAAERRDRQLAQRVMIVNQPASDGEVPLRLTIGDVQGRKEVYRPLLDSLSDGPKSIAELAAVSRSGGRTEADAIEAISLMLHAGYVAFHAPISNSKPAKQLNAAIARAAAAGAPYQNIVATCTGLISGATDTQLMMLSALSERADHSEATLGQALLDCLARCGKTLIREGKPVEADALKEFAQLLARDFLRTTWPEWQRQGVL